MNIEKRVSIRIVGTVYIFYLIHNYAPVQYKFLAYTFIAFITDLLDCDFIRIFDRQISCRTYEYQSWDKILDFFTYLVIIILAKPFYSDFIFNILIIFLIWRGIGVIKYNLYKEVKYLWKYVDALNITMIIAYLSSIYPSIKNNQVLLLIIGIMIKLKFEKKHHKINYLKN
jgi:hypothetical protein